MQGFMETKEPMCNNQAGFKKLLNTMDRVIPLSLGR